MPDVLVSAANVRFPPLAAHAKGHWRTAGVHLGGVEVFDGHESSSVVFRVAPISDAFAKKNRHTELTGFNFSWSVSADTIASGTPYFKRIIFVHFVSTLVASAKVPGQFW